MEGLVSFSELRVLGFVMFQAACNGSGHGLTNPPLSRRCHPERHQRSWSRRKDAEVGTLTEDELKQGQRGFKSEDIWSFEDTPSVSDRW